MTGRRDSAAEKTAYGYDVLGRRNDVKEYTSSSWLTPRRTELTTFNSVTGGVAGVTTAEAGPGGVTMTGQVLYTYDAATGRKLSTSTASTAKTFGYDTLGHATDVYGQLRHGDVMIS